MNSSEREMRKPKIFQKAFLNVVQTHYDLLCALTQNRAEISIWTFCACKVTGSFAINCGMQHGNCLSSWTLLRVSHVAIRV